MVLKVRVVEAKGACSRFSCKPGLWLMQDVRVSGELALPARLTAAPREGVSHHLRFIGWEIEVALGLREPSCRCQHRRSREETRNTAVPNRRRAVEGASAPWRISGTPAEGSPRAGRSPRSWRIPARAPARQRPPPSRRAAQPIPGVRAGAAPQWHLGQPIGARCSHRVSQSEPTARDWGRQSPGVNKTPGTCGAGWAEPRL